MRRAFRSRRGWTAFLSALADVLAERIPEAGTPPALDLVEAAQLYQTLYWVARTAAVPTPETDVLHVTAAGWSAIPAVVHKALHGTPMVLTEHGVYLREAYLAQVRSGDSPGRALHRHAAGPRPGPLGLRGRRRRLPGDRRQRLLGDGPRHRRRARSSSSTTACASRASRRSRPRTRTVVSVGRIDPLKDIHTLLRVAAETLRLLPDARFLHYGSVSPGEEAYGRSCHALHAQLGLGERFRFMGRTTDPNGAVRDADVVLMTSISEGLPMSILEAMSEARPVVSTGVGGVPGRRHRLRRRHPAGRRPRPRDGGRHAAAQPGPRVRGSAGAATPGSGASSTRRRASTATATCCAADGGAWAAA